MQAFYESAWQLPGIAWVSNAIFLLFFLRRQPERHRAYLFLVATGMLVDAWFTGALSPLEHWSIAVFFVIAGDWRYFYLVDRRPLPSLAIAFVTPLLQTALLPWVHGRWRFACYEAIFIVVASLYKRDRQATGYVITTYALWLGADLFILYGHINGWDLRLCANILYYGGFVWFAAWRLRSS